MKQLFLKLALCASILLVGCTVPKHDAISWIKDRSDTMDASSDIFATTLLKETNLRLDNNSGATVLLSSISDKRFNKSFTISIPTAERWFSNEITRTKEITSFIDRVDTSIAQITREPIGTKNSKIFETVAIELNKLAALKHCATKRCFLISDLHQNSPLMSVYSNFNDIDKMLAAPDLFRALLDSNCPIKFPLTKIQINLIHLPRSVPEDDIFYKMSSLYAGYLRSKGATVEIKTSM